MLLYMCEAETRGIKDYNHFDKPNEQSQACLNYVMGCPSKGFHLSPNRIGTRFSFPFCKKELESDNCPNFQRLASAS